eukprot:scaffold485_cov272-Pinguiococcus_pyrenoidosus.AAC.15
MHPHEVLAAPDAPEVLDAAVGSVRVLLQQSEKQLFVHFRCVLTVRLQPPAAVVAQQHHGPVDEHLVEQRLHAVAGRHLWTA